jgi:hypothetical protein
MTRHNLGRIIVVKEIEGKKYIKDLISHTEVISSYKMQMEE